MYKTYPQLTLVPSHNACGFDV